MKRQKKKAKVSARSSSSQSSDDSEQVKTLNIIDRMSRKYMGKERRRSPRHTSYKSSSKTDRDMYEGDVENNAESSSQESAPSPSAEIYDFVPAEDEVRLKLILSPNKAASPTKPKTSKKIATRTSKRKLNGKSSEKEKYPKLSSSNENKFTRKGKRSRDSSAADSGIFMTPPSMLGTDTHIDKTSPAPTSTPSVVLRPKTVAKGNLDFPGLSMLSPVQRVDTPEHMIISQSSLFLEEDMDYSVTHSAKRLSGKTYSEVRSDKKQPKRSSTDAESSCPKRPKISKKQKFAATISKAEEVADKMNREFEEIENFTLSIDG